MRARLDKQYRSVCLEAKNTNTRENHIEKQ